MKDWTRIPKDKVVVVSRRKFMRLRYEAKVGRLFDGERKALKERAALGWEQAEVAQRSYLSAERQAEAWMNEAQTAKEELAHLKLSLGILV